MESRINARGEGGDAALSGEAWTAKGHGKPLAKTAERVYNTIFKSKGETGMKWYAKLAMALGGCLILACMGFMIFSVWFKYERNDYVDSLNLRFAVATEVGELKATNNGVTTEIAPLNYNTILFYLTREPAFTLRRPAKDAPCIDLLLGETEHILVYETDDPEISLARTETGRKIRYHRLTYRDLYKQLALAVSEQGFREPNTVLSNGY